MKNYFPSSLPCATYFYSILVAAVTLSRCQNSSGRTTGHLPSVCPIGAAKASNTKHG